MILLKKDDRDEEFYFAPTKKKGGGKKKGADESKKGTSIKHDVYTFQLFDKLKLDAPVTTEEIPAVIEKLEAQLADYQQKVKDWELNRESQKAKIMAGEAEEEKEEEKAEKAEEEE